MATIVSDFVVIQGDSNVTFGDGVTLWEKTFNTTNRRSTGKAILMLMVRGLTANGVKVQINNESVGSIRPYRWPTEEMMDAASGHWHTQIINVKGSKLNNGENEIQIQAPPGGDPPEFFVRDVVCFFQQEA